MKNVLLISILALFCANCVKPSTNIAPPQTPKLMPTAASQPVAPTLNEKLNELEGIYIDFSKQCHHEIAVAATDGKLRENKVAITTALEHCLKNEQWLVMSFKDTTKIAHHPREDITLYYIIYLLEQRVRVHQDFQACLAADETEEKTAECWRAADLKFSREKEKSKHQKMIQLSFAMEEAQVKCIAELDDPSPSAEISKVLGHCINNARAVLELAKAIRNENPHPQYNEPLNDLVQYLVNVVKYHERTASCMTVCADSKDIDNCLKNIKPQFKDL